MFSVITGEFCTGLSLARMEGNKKLGTMEKACVLGAGAFGTALAQLMARQGVPTTAWTRSTDVTSLINRYSKVTEYNTPRYNVISGGLPESRSK